MCACCWLVERNRVEEARVAARGDADCSHTADHTRLRPYVW